ncbi:glycosyltransferase family 2 protein [Acidithiobacillus sp. HP-6]|uniref:glycosyltransferase family 2 protein n=1 Tax=unclassified Acidithiobacillus TaxID=2614800 RepID=UPI00187A3FA1|nr:MULTISPECIES: glycosyltransferase family 2 protein [unclassified Acidithiobacillus]MBE7564245.1 glycosyltransferase family 2 protein [Acidithiobacillus sp. HP-6]MBE7570904.1 glycosyltransferase family 2 protein [Acidithiobacillus sp. HP-2]
MKLGIGAIFRDEYCYVIEWLAHHMVAGFDKFFIADNGSHDGTRELLEALKQARLVELIYQPVLPENAQIFAYNRILEFSLSSIDVLIFIDADEFLVHDSFILGEVPKHLEQLFSDSTIDMVCLNWRCFGSSGLENQNEGLVIERFERCLGDLNGSIELLPVQSRTVNNHVKSAVRVSRVNKIDNVHVFFLNSGYKIVNCNGNQIESFVWPIDGIFQRASLSGLIDRIEPSPLRINHYVVKSKEEFLKKMKRGSAMGTIENFERNEEFFKYHDFDDSRFTFPDQWICAVKKKISEIYDILDHTDLNVNIFGCLDIVNEFECAGWLVRQNGNASNLMVSIFVNGVHQDYSLCKFYRPDVKDHGFSLDGICGFRYTHQKPLSIGDVVEVLVFGNKFRFENFSTVI